MSDRDWLRTDIGGADADSITVRGRDLASELMGQVTFTELAFLLVQGRRADRRGDGAARRRAGVARRPRADADGAGGPADAHGRAGVAPGRRRGGPAGRRHGVPRRRRGHGRLPGRDPRPPARPPTTTALARAAAALSAPRPTAGGRIPGLGHPIHKVEDPRTPRIYAIAAEQGARGHTCGRCGSWPSAPRRRRARPLPINGAGVAGAALADLGFPARIVRGFALLARTAGLVAHLAEEMQRPLGMPLFRDVERRAQDVRRGLAHVEGRLAGLLVGGERGGRRVDPVVARRCAACSSTRPRRRSTP